MVRLLVHCKQIAPGFTCKWTDTDVFTMSFHTRLNKVDYLWTRTLVHLQQHQNLQRCKIAPRIFLFIFFFWSAKVGGKFPQRRRPFICCRRSEPALWRHANFRTASLSHWFFSLSWLRSKVTGVVRGDDDDNKKKNNKALVKIDDICWVFFLRTTHTHTRVHTQLHKLSTEELYHHLVSFYFLRFLIRSSRLKLPGRWSSFGPTHTTNGLSVCERERLRTRERVPVFVRLRGGASPACDPDWGNVLHVACTSVCVRVCVWDWLHNYTGQAYWPCAVRTC